MNICSQCGNEFLACTCYPEDFDARHDPIFGRRANATTVRYLVYRVDVFATVHFLGQVNETIIDRWQFVFDNYLDDLSDGDKVLVVDVANATEEIFIVEIPIAPRNLVAGTVPGRS